MMGMRLDHARKLAVLIATMLALMLPPAGAQERFLDIRPGGAFKPVTIAVTNFSGDADAAKITGIITSNFKRSIFLSPVDRPPSPSTT